MLLLKVNGTAYSGWKSVRVTRSIEQIAGSFSLTLSEAWAEQAQAWPIEEGDPCEISLHGEIVCTGFIDSRSLSFGPGERSISVTGRDRAGDLIDCSANLTKWEYANADVMKVATDLCQPYGVGVSKQTGLQLPHLSEKLSIDPGETVASALTTLAKKAGVMLVSDGIGGLVLARAGTLLCQVDLVQGKNILGGTANFDFKNRFRQYSVIGGNRGTPKVNGKNACAIKGNAFDENIRFARNLIVRAEGNVTTAQARIRAQFEATVRAARGDTVTVKVQGWKQKTKLWPINALVKIDCQALGVKGTMLITQAVHSLDISGGKVTELTLRSPKAFLPEPTIKKDPTNNYWNFGRGKGNGV